MSLTDDIVSHGTHGTHGTADAAPAGGSRVNFRYYNYRFSERGVVTALRYAWVQIYTFFVALGYLYEKDVEFYINTILPVGPAVAGWLMRKRVIYHYHENAMVKVRMYRALAWVMQRVATEIICVSEYQRSFLKRQEGVKVVPNALDEEFLARAVVDVEGAFERKTVLMLGSLKGYKGTKEFVELARRLEQYRFVLVLNDEQENIDRYFEENGLVATENLKVYARQEDVVPFYREASVVLNLTDKTQAIETFGLTALEARAFGLPVIVPTVGGIAEMVEDGVNGWKIDVQELDVIAMRIEEMLSDREVYGCFVNGQRLKVEI
jgi:glycosyltransferase involved in cell wall biosynthesis